MNEKEALDLNYDDEVVVKLVGKIRLVNHNFLRVEFPYDYIMDVHRLHVICKTERPPIKVGDITTYGRVVALNSAYAWLEDGLVMHTKSVACLIKI